MASMSSVAASPAFVGAPATLHAAVQQPHVQLASIPAAATGASALPGSTSFVAVVAAAAAGLARKAIRRTGRSQHVACKARGGAFDASTQPGAIEPLGFWDPCGFTKGKSEEEFLELRGYELKHGRVAMMAIIGFLGQHYWKFPYTADVPNGVQAAYTYPGSVGLGFLFLVTGFFELRLLPERETTPGNFGDPFKLIDNKMIGGYDDKWRNMELSNSRLAMVGVIGTIVAGGYTGLDAFEQWDAARPVAIDFVKRTIPFAP